MTVLCCTQYSSIFINIHQYSSIFINIHQYSSIFINIHQYSSIFINIHQYSSIFINIHQYSSIFINIHQYSSIFINIHQYSSIFINIHQYSSIFINIYLNILHSAHSVHSVVSRKWLPLRILSHSLDGWRDRLSAACQVALKTPNSPWNAFEKRVYLHVCHKNIGKMNENDVLLPWNIYITGVWCCPLVFPFPKIRNQQLGTLRRSPEKRCKASANIRLAVSVAAAANVFKKHHPEVGKVLWKNVTLWSIPYCWIWKIWKVQKRWKE